jgi:hypothetical protein
MGYTITQRCKSCNMNTVTKSTTAAKDRRMFKHDEGALMLYCICYERPYYDTLLRIVRID